MLTIGSWALKALIKQLESVAQRLNQSINGKYLGKTLKRRIQRPAVQWSKWETTIGVCCFLWNSWWSKRLQFELEYAGTVWCDMSTLMSTLKKKVCWKANERKWIIDVGLSAGRGTHSAWIPPAEQTNEHQPLGDGILHWKLTPGRMDGWMDGRMDTISRNWQQQRFC